MKRGPTSRPEKAETLDRVIRILLYLLVFLPAAFGFLYVRSFGVDVPYGDTWKLVDLFEKWSSGTLGVSDLWEQHYEHRVIFPRIVMLSLGAVTRFDNVAIMYLIQACFLATLVVLLLAFRKSVDLERIPRLLLFAPIAFLVFNPSQNWNMLQAWSLTFVFVQVFSVLALYLLYAVNAERSGGLTFLAALVSGTIASFSSAQGLLVWPAGLLQLLLTPLERRAKTFLVGIWSMVGLAEWVVYFLGWEAPTRHSAGSYFYTSPHLGVDYLLAALGSSLLWHHGVAVVVGLMLICLAPVGLLLVYKAGRLRECRFWVALLSFSLLFLASITAGRSGLGIENALHSKYVSFSVLATIGIYSMLTKLAFERRSRIGVVSLTLLFALMAASVPISYAQGVRVGESIEAKREELAFALATYKSQPDEVLSKVHTTPARKRASILERLNYSVFSEPRPQVLPPALSTLSYTEAAASSNRISRVGTVAGLRTAEQGRLISVPEGQPTVAVTGRAVDADGEGYAGGVYVEIDDQLFPAFYNRDEAGLLNKDGSPSRGRFRFERAIPVSKVGSGIHDLSIIVVTGDQRGYYRPDQKMILKVTQRESG